MATSRDRVSKKDTSSSRSASPKGIGMDMGASSVKPMKMSEEMRYRAEADMGTLHRAHQIITDKPRHAAAMQHASEVFAAAKSPGISVSKKK